jgi:carbon storage regulator CsrA
MSRLVLTRCVGQSIKIGDNIFIKLLYAGYRKAEIEIVAPPEVKILRDNAKTREERQNAR